METREGPHVRCFSCGSSQRASDDQCGRCGVPFLVLCECGDPHSAYLDACPKCGEPVPQKRFPAGRLPAVRILKWTLAVAVIGGPAALLLLREQPETPWGLKESGLAHFRAEQYPEAARDFEAATRLDPRDKLAWLNLAHTWRQLGLSAETWTGAARTAVDIDPDFADARKFLAAAAAERGDVEEAHSHATAVLALSPSDPHAARMVAELELRRRQPDLLRALSAVREALRRDRESVELTILHAEVLLAIHGLQQPGSYPADVEAALDAARRSLERLDGKRLPPVQLATLKARIHLATGSPADAFTVAQQALEDLPGGAPKNERLALLLLKARGLHAWRKASGPARQDFQAALALSPDEATVATITRYLLGAGDAALAETLLAGAAQQRDPDGAVAAGLAEVRLARGELPGALEAVGQASTARPDQPSLLLLEGRIHAAAGRLPEAKGCYRRAAQLAPRALEPRVQTALLALAPATDVASRDAALRAAIDDVTALTADGAPAGVRLVLAQLLVAARREGEAERELARVTSEAPSLADAWTLYAETLSRRGAPEAAASAYARARALRPDDPSPAALEARTLLAIGDSAGAIDAANGFLHRHPESAAIREIRLEANLTLGLWKAALEDLRWLADADPSSERWLLQSVETEMRAGRRDDALRRIDQALARTDGTVSSDARALLVALRGEALGAAPDAALASQGEVGSSGVLAALEMRAGRYDAALATARRVLFERPGDPVATEVLVLLQCDRGSKDAAAIEEARKAAEALHPSATPGLASLLRARLALAGSKDEDAFREATEAVRLLPSHPVAAFLLGEAACRTGRTAEGLAALRRSVWLPGAAPVARRWAARRFADAAAKETSPGRAREQASVALQLDPSCLDASIRLARLLALAGDPRAAADVLDRAVRQPGLAPEAATALRIDSAVLNAVGGDDTRALAHLDTVERSGSAPPRLSLVRGWVCLSAKRLDDAQRAFDRARAECPGEPALALGRAALALERSDAAAGRVLVDGWRAEHPDDDLVPVGYSVRLRDRGETDAAAALLREVLKARPSSRAAATTLAGLLVSAGRTSEGVQAARDWIEAAQPADRVWARCLLAECLAQSAASATQGLELARELAAEAEGVPGLAVRATAAEAQALLLLGKPAEAQARAKSAPQEDLPRDVEFVLRHVEGMAAAAQGDLPGAREALSRAVELRPRDPVALNNAAWVLAQSPGTAKNALDLARQATTLRPSSPTLWDTRAVAAAAASTDEEAESSWTEALRLAAADPASDPDGRARIALRFSRHLAARQHADRSREIAASVARFEPAPQADLLDAAKRLSRN